MRTRSLILHVLLVTLSGCIGTYRDFPIVDPLPSPYEPAAPPRCHQTVQFSYGLAEGGPYSGVLSPAHVSRALQEALQQYAGCSSGLAVVYPSKWPGTEVVVGVLEKPYPWHWYGEYIGRISSHFAFIIPFYINEGGWEFSYSVYDRHGLKKTYKYDITARHFYWVVLLPFSWINFFTYSLEDVVRSTTAQFVIDAERDEYLGTKN